MDVYRFGFLYYRFDECVYYHYRDYHAATEIVRDQE